MMVGTPGILEFHLWTSAESWWTSRILAWPMPTKYYSVLSRERGENKATDPTATPTPTTGSTAAPAPHGTPNPQRGTVLAPTPTAGTAAAQTRQQALRLNQKTNPCQYQSPLDRRRNTQKNQFTQ